MFGMASGMQEINLPDGQILMGYLQEGLVIILLKVPTIIWGIVGMFTTISMVITTKAR